MYAMMRLDSEGGSVGVFISGWIKHFYYCASGVLSLKGVKFLSRLLTPMLIQTWMTFFCGTCLRLWIFQVNYFFNEVRRVLLIECEHNPRVKWELLGGGGVFTALAPYSVEGWDNPSDMKRVHKDTLPCEATVSRNGKTTDHAGQRCHGNGKLMNEWHHGDWEVRECEIDLVEQRGGVRGQTRFSPSPYLLFSSSPCASGFW